MPGKSKNTIEGRQRDDRLAQRDDDDRTVALDEMRRHDPKSVGSPYRGTASSYDYNMLLISRLREESANNIRVGVMRTVASTGSVITSAGLIFAASMFGLMVGSIGIMIQMGFIIGCGLLLDMFVVRTLTVPAIATLLGEASWWLTHRV